MEEAAADEERDLEAERCSECTGALEERGDGVMCMACGLVASRAPQLSSEVMFDAEGKGHFGTFVPDFGDGPSASSDVAAADRSARGRAVLGRIAGALNIKSVLVDAAVRLLRLAQNAHFTLGRRLELVCAACLYYSCRSAGTDHMLVDFAELLQANVFHVGAVFLKMFRFVKLVPLPLVDPALYVQRFAARLQLGSHTECVAQIAARVVARMDRDWLTTGRRPAGVCGAALFVACRLYGCSRDVWEIVQVAKVCDQTLRKRVREFLDAPCADLALHEFSCVDLERTGLPPAFEKAADQLKMWEDLDEKARAAITVQAREALDEPGFRDVPLSSADESDAPKVQGLGPSVEEEELSEINSEEAEEYIWAPAVVSHRRSRWEAEVGSEWELRLSERQASGKVSQPDVTLGGGARSDELSKRVRGAHE